MAGYAAQRILAIAPTTLALSLLLFVLMRLTPGSPLQPDAPNANPLGPEAQALLAREWGLDQPILVQYLRFLERAAQFDFGSSYYFKARSVSEILPPLVPVSLHLGLMALALAVVGGGSLGILAAAHQNGPIDRVCTLAASLAVALPSFVCAVLLIALFVLGLGVIPRTGGWEHPVDWILPTIALALGPLGVLARYTRSSVLEVIRLDYVRTARAKGLRERRVLLVHVLRNALVPPLTILGPISAAVLTGSPFVESVFRVPGIGRYLVESILARDYPVIMAVFLFYGLLLQLAALASDLLCGLADPRIRQGIGR